MRATKDDHSQRGEPLQTGKTSGTNPKHSPIQVKHQRWFTFNACAGHKRGDWTWASHELGQWSWGWISNPKQTLETLNASEKFTWTLVKLNLQISRVNEIIASRPPGQAMPAIGCHLCLNLHKSWPSKKCTWNQREATNFRVLRNFVNLMAVFPI